MGLQKEKRKKKTPFVDLYVYSLSHVIFHTEPMVGPVTSTVHNRICSYFKYK